MRHRLAFAAALVACATALFASAALAHIERTSYWPDPRPDTSVSPPAGGEVPTIRSLASALNRSAPGDTRVVCRPDSMKRLAASVKRARTKGYRLRPTQPLLHLSRKQADRLMRTNRSLHRRCRFDEIQAAITASHNNDRVVILPGVYTEPSSRKVPSLPPECDKYRTTSENGSGAVSYTYQANCPNAVNAVALIGRKVGPGTDPPQGPTGRADPHGIPNLGACVRCNVQVEGSGVKAEDVVLDAGRVASGNKGPTGAVKDVGFRIDRADGAVLRNMTFRHAAEHGLYIHETDGYMADRVKFFYNGEYGLLTFTSDHGVTQDCEGTGSGDSAVYPGAAPDTGAQRREDFYPERRLNQTIQRCDLHHNNLGYSGTMGNATHVVDNNFYENTTGIATDSFFAGGHPGYPQDSAVFENNRIFSNNFNVYAKDSDVESSVPVPIGVGILIAGGNDDIVRHNRIYDNWRRGTMLMSVPDAISCAPNPEKGAAPCTPKGPATVSNRNLYRDNVMGIASDGTKQANGVDFWWDEFPTNQGNCWYPNTGIQGTTASITGDPPPPPVEGSTIPKFLPEDCDSPANVGVGNPVKEAALVGCVLAFEGGTDIDGSAACEWFQMPERPGSQAAADQQAAQEQAARANVGRLRLDAFCSLIGPDASELTCPPFVHRISPGAKT